VLQFEILPDGGVRVEASERELRDLASFLLEAAVKGEASPAFASDRALTVVAIVRRDL
jgi:hypothetical protein